MFERFHQDARSAVVQAREEAVRAGRPIGSEHLLLGLLHQDGTAAEALTAAGVDAAGLRSRLPRGGDDPPETLDADALAALGIDLDAVRRATDAAFGRGALDRAGGPQGARRRAAGRTRMTPGAKQALERALHTAVRLRHRSISSGHLLLGILDQPGSPAVEALLAAGVDIEDLRADVLRRMTVAA